jgi:hypothetical protein
LTVAVPSGTDDFECPVRGARRQTRTGRVA